MSQEERPLLPSDQEHHEDEETAVHTASTTAAIRRQTKRFLTSKTGHYAVLVLVALDITGIFADLLVTSLSCEGRIDQKAADQTSEVLGILSLVFSSLFMAELLASVWSFGLAYFRSWFHCRSVDATVIIVGLAIDILLRGVLEEIGSIVVVLRLWRVIKIIEELSAGAEEQIEPLSERIEDLEKENGTLKRKLDDLELRLARSV